MEHHKQVVSHHVEHHKYPNHSEHHDSIVTHHFESRDRVAEKETTNHLHADHDKRDRLAEKETPERD